LAILRLVTEVTGHHTVKDVEFMLYRTPSICYGWKFPMKKNI